MLLIIDPVPIVLGPIDVDVDAPPVSFIFFPEAVEHVAISMPKLAPAMGLVIFPSALVLGSIRPDLHSVTVTVVFLPLSFVYCAVIKYIFFFKVNFWVFLFVKFFFFRYCLIICFR
jgi:hypothetical protein